ncbi:LEAF RUST 10 DISEASE-RESISTANCE LOCUS RECEPTOR-LIKE PROTEIN KINASE-like 2.5 [Impatiens glandulifera]|uniref:LEAF RUST 10 DISEASE-RESISTANCE LOCUS RECEPTOR-LIKE PROTEIN KINASE-like 2.5 n=1 Tax=Impatiens glandulifera TaxID=253017 RepID=UPI001FB0E54F|nr:LEAF RUST 10 DISEASE-RESISTANCE LOCUS RECEPTOR-LIKE PROTEIN KINASE-like 2.5 [Impatiens glandulifera]
MFEVSRRSNLLSVSSIVLLLLLLLLVLNCRASSCGDIHNISFPFRLGGGGGGGNKRCLFDDYFSLSCEEDNRTYLSLHSVKYHVQSINYGNSSIRLTPVGLDTTNCSSLPLYSVNLNSFNLYSLPISMYYIKWPFPRVYSVSSTWPTPVTFLSCESPLPAKSSRYYIDVSASCNLSSSSFRSGTSLYAVVGNITLMNIEDSCTVETTGLTSDPNLLAGSRVRSNLSYQDVHNALALGFDTFWQFKICGECEKRAYCLGGGDASSLCQKGCFERSGTFWLIFDATIRRTSISVLSFFLVEPLIDEYLSWTRDNQVFSLIVDCSVFLLLITVLWFLLRILCMPCIFGFLIYKFKRRHFSTFDNIEGFLRGENNFIPIRYSFWEIRKMTNGFRDKLGEGGYGCVYKGTLRSGTLVAVKMLSKAKADGQEFINEVSTLGRIHHLNVVQLIGYCAERHQRALVYDFMPNGSLEKYIFSKEDNPSLSYDQLFEISLGVARGIEYLHRGCDMQILHFDIKPHNILLGEDFTPKVSDFGLAKLYPAQDSIVPLTAVRGTMGYIAPELFYRNIGGLSYKADVYSFGMLLMEMASKRKNWSSSVSHSSQIYYPSWVNKQFSDGIDVEMGDMTNEEAKIVRKMMLVALWCIQMKPSDRPTMHKVVEMLEGDAEVIEIPPKPFLFGEDMVLENNNIFNISGAGVDAITMDFSAR